ncbi:hypothetical protein HZA33_02955 [Candidatus Pacearchaeota archaeon]|nr:hypothetical protein [Candidatus Pacearchaeota archaeon]
MTEEINLKKLAEFLVRAKKATYAGNGAEVQSQRPGYKELEYVEGDWNYRDSYTQFFLAPGEEVVRFKGNVIWSMAYRGGMREAHREDENFAHEVFKFLKKALSNVPENIPFRGPVTFHRGEFQYTNFVEGDIEDFSGIEMITLKREGEIEEVFRQRYIGGIAKGK